MTSPVSAIEAIEKVMEGVTPCGYQRRPAYEYRSETVSGTPWSLCATQEATDMFERVPGFEYRPIYDAKTVLALARKAESGSRSASAPSSPTTSARSAAPAHSSEDLKMQSEITERAKTAWNSIADEFNQWDALGLDEQETYVALTAALVDVPAVEAVNDDLIGYVLRYGGMCRDCADMDGVCQNGQPCDTDQRRAVAKHTISALAYGIKHGFVANPFTSPPLSREGEESAEVIEELLRHLDRMQSNAIRAGELAWHPSSPIAESIEKVRVLAATRSGSSTTASGGDHG